MITLTTEAKEILETALAEIGSKSTKQRELVFATLLDQRDHPTAEEVYARLKESTPSISLATVYNCLETLVSCGLVKQVNIEREPNRYCPNLAEHAHFHCKKTGRVYDIDLPEQVLNSIKNILPQGYMVDTVKVHFEGQCPQSINNNNENSI